MLLLEHSNTASLEWEYRASYIINVFKFGKFPMKSMSTPKSNRKYMISSEWSCLRFYVKISDFMILSLIRLYLSERLLRLGAMTGIMPIRGKVNRSSKLESMPSLNRAKVSAWLLIKALTMLRSF